MTSELAVAIIAGAAIILAGLVGATGIGWTVWSTIRGQDRARISSLENRVDKLEHENHTLWAENGLLREWAAQLVAHILAGKPPPPPKVPDGLVIRDIRYAPDET